MTELRKIYTDVREGGEPNIPEHKREQKVVSSQFIKQSSQFKIQDSLHLPRDTLGKLEAKFESGEIDCCQSKKKSLENDERESDPCGRFGGWLVWEIRWSNVVDRQEAQGMIICE